ncbi:mechanosensitive ion channel family protein [Flavobacterium tegetincola]|uniref:mechanosensitive ion channel family protein n=1 Tax=Flavobacterium tegetincola TaxID=150172 RepID=UPI00040F52D2|nr:mechanosensitive ion channel domain-containing protein [Flavobacterium tegetincola]
MIPFLAVNFTPEDIQRYTEQFITSIVHYIPSLISAFLLLFVGLYLVRLINRFVRRIMLKREYDPSLSKFMADILLWIMRIMLFVAVIDQLGIGTSSFVAILGAMGLAVGLSLQGSLSNFAGGMLIIMFKPFKIGDFIEAQGVSGTVTEIQIFITKLTTTNNQVIFVPNGALSNGNITNYSEAGTRRANITFTVSYDADLKRVKEILHSILEKDSRILKEPKPGVVVTGLVDNGVTMAVRPWATNADYWDMYSDVLQDMKKQLDDDGLEIQPFVKEASINKISKTK